MFRPLHGLLLVLLPTAGMAQCDHVFNIEQTGNCVIPGFDLIVNVSGGTPPYEFTWYAQGNPVGTGPSLPVWSLQGGASVTVQAIDALGCTQWSPEYWIMTGEAISATATVAPDPLDCSNNVITLNDVNIAGGCGDVLVTLNSPAEVIGTITGPTITLTGMPSGPNEFLLIPTGACAYCISSLIVNVPNTCGANTITGRVYVDADNSCSFTTGDQSVTGMFVEAMGPGPQTTSTGANGLYTAHVTNGQYSVGIPSLPPIWSITCQPNAGDPVAVPPNASGMDIGLGPVGIFNDLGVEITGIGPHRNGMNTQVSITCTNRGNTTLDGTAVLTFDASLSFVGSTPSASAQVGNTVEWSLPALPPFASSTLTATLSIPVSAMLGDVLVYTATILADPSDDMATNDAASLERVITGSFDPNDKMVFREGDLLKPEVLAGT
ncbi:MAG: DUF11 domain-containing protein, partial [Flavobacteriales bacterium]|nr:DUF11 domain-containing protein [Flavobacteriales bacterium]